MVVLGVGVLGQPTSLCGIQDANSPAVQGLADSDPRPCPGALVLIGLLWLAYCGGECTARLLSSASNEDFGEGVTRRMVLWDVCGRVGDEAISRETREAVCGRMDVAIAVVFWENEVQEGVGSTGCGVCKSSLELELRAE